MSEPSLPPPLPDDRDADWLEAQSVKWNVARIVRLSSGRFALLTHYNEGALNLIKVGTLEEIANYIPSASECEADYVPRVGRQVQTPGRPRLTSLDLADLGL